MKLARSSNSSTPSPQGSSGAASMSPMAGTSVRWSRNSAFFPVRSAAAAADTPAAEMSFADVATASQLMSYGFMNPMTMSPYLWPLILPYPPFAAAATGASHVLGAGPHHQHHHNQQQPHFQQRLHNQQQQQHHLQPQQRPRQLFSPDRASVDAAGQTPEKAKFGKSSVKKIIFLDYEKWSNFRSTVKISTFFFVRCTESIWFRSKDNFKMYTTTNYVDP